MSSVMVIHTVPSVIKPFCQKLGEKVPNVMVCNLLDEYMSIDTNRCQGFKKKHYDRLRVLLDLCLADGPDLIVTTCSTLSSALIRIRHEYPVPIITVDERMIQKAVEAGQEILILATAKSSVQPLTNGLNMQAKALGISLPEISVRVFPEAFEALRNGNTNAHDKLIIDAAHEIEHKGIIILSQVSMGHLREQLAEITGCRVLGAAESCIQEISERLGAMRG